MSEALAKLRSCITSDSPIQLLNGTGAVTNDISQASQLSLDGEKFTFENESVVLNNLTIGLRSVYNAWLMKDSPTADYISSSQSKNIPTVSFNNRNKLFKYLDGSESSIDGLTDKSNDTTDIKEDKTDTFDKKNSDNDEIMIDYQDVDSNLLETPLLHNNLYQGSKLIDFNYLIKESQTKIVNDLKKSTASGKFSKPDSKPSYKQNQPTKTETPIILLSPSTAALLQLSNIKDFLEQGRFHEPSNVEVSSMTGTGIIRIKRNLPILGPQMFVIVNSTDSFTKADYWNRVVAVFTTGQTWQFKNYVPKEPELLFQKYKGYYLGYKGDMINRNIKDWNVEIVEVDRNRRFNDQEIVKQFWASLERSMLAQGYKKNS